MFEEIFKILSPLSRILPTGENVKQIFKDIIGGTTRINQTFTQSRERVQELGRAIADTVPMVNRLGGSSTDVVEIMDTIAKTTKRNVVGSGEEISRLFAAAKLSGTETKDLIDKYQNIGVQFTQIGTSLEKSIGYIQSVGGNSRDILKDMNQYVENLNKFSFQDGVLGLTRMATQAQLLKFDMKTTLSFADQLLSPEKAVEMASTFQRLGVSVGNLTDPFQLMNKALTDPEGLQKSIVEMTKQFTYFDDKAKQFKIAPQGMLMLREIAKEMGTTSDELSKMAINASELDRRLSMISPSFEFENEEDRQYIANIAKMGASGEYEITLTDEKDKTTRTISLQEASNEELRELVRLQKTSKDVNLENLQRDQLDILTLVYGELDAIRNGFFGGIASSKSITEVISGTGNRKEIFEALEKLRVQTKIPTTQEMRKRTDDTITDIKPVIAAIFGETKEFMKSLKPTVDALIISLDQFKKGAAGSVLENIKKFERRTGSNFPDMGEDFLERLRDGASTFFPKEIQNMDVNNFDVRSLNMPFFPGNENPNPNVIPTRYSPNNQQDLSMFYATNVKKGEVKVEFGDLPVFKIVFSKESNFDYPVDKIKDYLEKPEVLRPLVEKMIPIISEYQQPKKDEVPYVLVG